MYLLDTNIVSELAPIRVRPPIQVSQWIREHQHALFISVVTIAEVEAGIAKSERLGARRKAISLANWLESILALYASRILPLDLPTSRLAGRLTDMARSLGRSPGFADLAIAATAQLHDCIVITRNLRHFRDIGIAALDPFDPSFRA